MVGTTGLCVWWVGWQDGLVGKVFAWLVGWLVWSLVGGLAGMVACQAWACHPPKVSLTHIGVVVATCFGLFAFGPLVARPPLLACSPLITFPIDGILTTDRVTAISGMCISGGIIVVVVVSSIGGVLTIGFVLPIGGVWPL